MKERGINPHDKTNQPNPERWMSRFQRTSYKKARRRRRGFGGGQGVGDTTAQDSVKYDVFSNKKNRELKKLKSNDEKNKEKKRLDEAKKLRQAKAGGADNSGKRKKKGGKKGRRK